MCVCITFLFISLTPTTQDLISITLMKGRDLLATVVGVSGLLQIRGKFEVMESTQTLLVVVHSFCCVLMSVLGDATW